MEHYKKFFFSRKTQKICMSFHYKKEKRYKLYTEKGEAKGSPSQHNDTHETTKRCAKLRDTNTTTTSPPATTLKGQGLAT